MDVFSAYTNDCHMTGSDQSVPSRASAGLSPTVASPQAYCSERYGRTRTLNLVGDISPQSL